MKLLSITILSVILLGCGSTSSELISELRLDRCEIGEVTVQGNVGTSGLPWGGANLNVFIHEKQTADTLPYSCLE